MKILCFILMIIFLVLPISESCEEFHDNEVCDVTNLTELAALEGVESEELCQLECRMLQDCAYFSWVKYSKDYVCHLLTVCASLSKCEYPCIYAVSGPVSPAYTKACCPGFQDDRICSHKGFIANIPYIKNKYDCQVACITFQSCSGLPTCKFFTYDALYGSCQLFSTCESVDECHSCFTGPHFPGIEICEQQSTSSTSGSLTTESSTTVDFKDDEYAVLIGKVDGNNLGSNVELWYPGEFSTCDIPTIPDIVDIVDGSTSVLIGNTIMYCGGVSYLAGCYTFTVGSSSNTWDQAPSLKYGRHYFTMNIINNMIIATGGGYTDQGILSSVEVFMNGSWTEMVDWRLTSPRSTHCAVKYGSSKLVITGGSSNYNYLTLVEQLDTSTGVWTQMPSMKYSRHAHSCVSFVDESTEFILVAGGYKINVNPLDSVERFSSATNTWEELPKLNTARWLHSIGILDGYITIMGGRNEIAYLTSTEYLNGSHWEYGKELLFKRQYHTMVILNCN